MTAPRQYADRTQHQNGSTITSGASTLTIGTLLSGQGLSALAFPYTVAVSKIDGTNYEEMDITGGSFPNLAVTRGINHTTAVSHDTTEVVTQVVGQNDLANFAQIGNGPQTGSINVSGSITSTVGSASVDVAHALQEQALFPGYVPGGDTVTTTFNSNGTISETYNTSGITVTTTFNSDGSVTQVFSGGPFASPNRTKATAFGTSTITETIT